MKVKELAGLFKTSIQELLSILPNVGIDTSNGEETFVEKDVEKKLAKRYGVAYPFKAPTPKPKQVVNVAAKAAETANQKQAPKPKPFEKTVNVVTPKTVAAKQATNQNNQPKPQNQQNNQSKPQNSQYNQNRNQGGQNQSGQNQSGQNQGSYNQNGYNRSNQSGNYNNQNRNQGGQNQSGYNQGGQNQGGYNRFNQSGNYNNQNRNQGGQNQGGYNQGGYNQGSYNQGGYNQGGYNRSNQSGNYNNQNRNQGGQNQGGYNQNGYNQGGYNRSNQSGNYNNQKPRSTPRPAPKPIIRNPEDELRHEQIKKIFLAEAEQVVPRIDEETLDKYQGFVEEETFVPTKEKTGKKKVIQDDSVNNKGRKKNNIKNKVVRKVEGRTSNIPQKEENEENVLYYEKGMTVMEVAAAMNIGVTDLVKKLFTSMGIMASATNSLDRETAELIAIEYDYELKDKAITDMIRFDEMAFVDQEEDLISRPAIVTIMGHVDHGKTTLLDTIRSSHVVKGEAGGITQHIGAYQVEKSGKLITFIDTPGHAAFTEMRARGAQITDIVVLVVAADDGVMPQTKEAIEHAQAANVPIIVAINKTDKPGANIDRIKQELTEYNLLAEDWGGDTIFVPISALTGKGVPELLEMIILSADLKDYKANPNRLGVGTVIEAKLDKGRGPVATLLVQNGTLKIGDIIVVGNTYGKIRAMSDEYGKQIKSAGPAKPVEITGLEEVPFAGEKFMAINDEKQAKAIAEVRSYNKFADEMGVGKSLSLNEVFKNQKDTEIKELNLIIKCDVQGSIEAIKGLLDKIIIEGTKINIVSARVGGITDNDISLAVASHAIIIGFNIRPTTQISDMAKDKGIEIRLYNIIYKLQEDIEKAVKGMLDPVFEEKISGQAEVREIFKVGKIGTIAGSYVTSGSIVRNSGVRLIRDSIVVYTGKLAGLRRFKDDVKEVKAGYECGITIENYNDIKVGDIVECFVMEEVERD